jgi:hypothetical protein
MQSVTAGTPVATFKQPTGITTKTVDAFSGMLPGPYTTKTYSEVFIKGTEPTQVDNTKVPVDVDTDTNTLWTPDCAGTKETKGFLDLSQVDASNANFQKYDDIWIATAKRGLGARGGPNGSPTNYFYEAGFYTPYGASWGAPFAPTTSCITVATPPPSPSDSASPSVGPSVSAAAPAALAPASPAAAANPATTSQPNRPQPAPAALMLVPMGLLGLIGKLRARQASRVGARGRHSRH